MKKYVLHRFLQLIPILLGITFLSFAMMRLAGSDVVTEMYQNRGWKPAFVIGVPVGFVNVEAAKEMIMETDIPAKMPIIAMTMITSIKENPF